LVIAERLGYVIHQEPVKWVDNPDSRVKILPTAIQDVLGLLRLKRTAPRHAVPNKRIEIVRAPP
jgi:hypothetical protein